MSLCVAPASLCHETDYACRAFACNETTDVSGLQSTIVFLILFFLSSFPCLPVGYLNIFRIPF